MLIDDFVDHCIRRQRFTIDSRGNFYAGKYGRLREEQVEYFFKHSPAFRQGIEAIILATFDVISPPVRQRIAAEAIQRLEEQALANQGTPVPSIAA